MKNNNGLTADDYEIKALLGNPRFIKDVLAFRKKWGIPTNGFATNAEENIWRDNNNDRLDEYRSEIHKLREAYNLSARWYEGLKWYVLRNNALMLRIQPAWKLKYTHVSEADVQDISLEVDANITQQEILSAQKAIKRKAGTKKQYIENIDRDTKALELRGQGKTYSEIAEWLNTNYPGTFNSDSVAKIIKRLSARHSRSN